MLHGKRLVNPKHKILAFVFFEMIISLLLIQAISNPDAPLCLRPGSGYTGECPPEKIAGTASTLIIPLSILFIIILIIGILEVRKII